MNWQQMALSVLGGAVIGYITNWVAIRMLFRPLQEKRLWGMRLPFTPGVIPRGKGRLARAIGEAVGGMLLTEKKVVQHLLQPEVEEQMRGFLASSMAGLREREVSLGEVLGSPADDLSFLPEFTELVSGLALKYVRGESARRAMSQLAKEAADYLLDQTVAAMVDAGGRGGIAGTLERLPAAIMQKPAVQQELQRRLAVHIENFFNSPQTIGYYLPGAVHEGIHQFIDDQAPRIIEAIEQFINSPSARQAIKDRIEGFFESSAVKRFINGIFQLMGNSADTLVQRLAAEITRFFANTKNREEFMRMLHGLAEEALGKSITDIAAGLGEDGKREKAAEIAAWGMAKLREPAVFERLAGGIREILANNRNLTWREMLNQVNPAASKQVTVFVEGLVEDLWERDTPAQYAEALVRREVAAAWKFPLGRLLDCLPEGFVSEPEGLATRLYRYLVQRVLPGLMRFIDIRSMVRARVEELDELQVEEMLLSIMRKELVAITWLGALLGALLGVFTVMMQYAMK
ncbi:hypothetical protein SPSYN_01220 [Sporotomaculum syntrophicum]|uniref:DUF445 family protein n=1 Tax=Sporotomaculum syntrophicum TaxID=182264 RepID=A0A9D2WPQ0_9FIRM|nr:DUF445 family protein [Sporotomaculum syntrophicum]KAF1085084.1 hypothetical protein SPSYN_01220 [Sporotomaculum syntrophicum]